MDTKKEKKKKKIIEDYDVELINKSCNGKKQKIKPYGGLEPPTLR